MSLRVRARARRHGDGAHRGAAAVEFALILPVLAIILFGIINFGFMLSDRQAVSQAAAEGARAAAVSLANKEAAGESAITDALTTQRLSCAGATCDVTLAPCDNETGIECATARVSLPYTPPIPGFDLVFPDRLTYTAVARTS